MDFLSIISFLSKTLKEWEAVLILLAERDIVGDSVYIVLLLKVFSA